MLFTVNHAHCWWQSEKTHWLFLRQMSNHTTYLTISNATINRHILVMLKTNGGKSCWKNRELHEKTWYISLMEELTPNCCPLVQFDNQHVHRSFLILVVWCDGIGHPEHWSHLVCTLTCQTMWSINLWLTDQKMQCSVQCTWGLMSVCRMLLIQGLGTFGRSEDEWDMTDLLIDVLLSNYRGQMVKMINQILHHGNFSTYEMVLHYTAPLPQSMRKTSHK